MVLLEEFDETRNKETTICGLSGRRYHAHVAKMCANVFFALFIHSSRETITFGHLGSRKSSNDVQRPIRAAPSRAPYFALERTSKVVVSRGECRKNSNLDAVRKGRFRCLEDTQCIQKWWFRFGSVAKTRVCTSVPKRPHHIF